MSLYNGSGAQKLMDEPDREHRASETSRSSARRRSRAGSMGCDRAAGARAAGHRVGTRLEARSGAYGPPAPPVVSPRPVFPAGSPAASRRTNRTLTPEQQLQIALWPRSPNNIGLLQQQAALRPRLDRVPAEAPRGRERPRPGRRSRASSRGSTPTSTRRSRRSRGSRSDAAHARRGRRESEGSAAAMNSSVASSLGHAEAARAQPRCARKAFNRQES